MPFKIEIEHSEFSNQAIHVESSSTIHVNIRNILDSEEKVENLRSDIAFIFEQAKQKGFKVKYNHPEYRGKRQFMAFISDLIERYQSEVTQYHALYEALLPKWEAKIGKGLFAPLSDDSEYDQLVREGWVIDGMFNKKLPIGAFNSVSNYLSELRSRVEASNSITFVTL